MAAIRYGVPVRPRKPRATGCVAGVIRTIPANRPDQRHAVCAMAQTAWRSRRVQRRYRALCSRHPGPAAGTAANLEEPTTKGWCCRECFMPGRASPRAVPATSRAR